MVSMAESTGEVIKLINHYGSTNRAVLLRYQNNTKLSTKSDGVDITGEVQCDSLDVDGDADLTGQVTSHNRFRVKPTNGGIYFGDTTGGFGDACAMVKAEVAQYHASNTHCLWVTL